MFSFKEFHRKVQSLVRLTFKEKFFNKLSSSNSKISFESLLSHPVWVFIQKRAVEVSSVVKKHWKFIIALFAAFLISDLLLIKSYNLLLPDKELPPLGLLYRDSYENLSPDRYKSVWENNIFHTGPIPLQLKEQLSVGLEPVLSSLPFKLKGTIIHANPRRSVATIAGPDRKTLSYQQGDVIAKQAEVKEIQRAKVIFFNQNNNRLEYIVIPEEVEKLQISYTDKPRPKVAKNSLVKRSGSNKFQVKRSDINEHLLNLPEILNQARVMPYRSEEDGEIEFRFDSIDKGSIFEDLGFKEGDVIKEVDGEAVRTPEKALELFDRLKKESGVKVLVQRNGKNIYYEYTVREDAAPLK